MRIFFAAVITLTVFADAESRCAEPIQGGYSTKPLEAAIFEPAKVAVEAAALNNWLNENYSSLTYETMKGPREHLYYLIDSWISSLYVRDKVVFPPKPDLLLQTLFSWAERLGVFGGHLVYNALQEKKSEPMLPLMEVPAPYALSFLRDIFRVDSKQGGWSVSFPYYFMIWNLSEFDAKDGPRTQLLALSTAAAVHKGVEGHSQATLMLLAGPGQDTATFENYWRTGLGFTGIESTQDLPIHGLKSAVKFDETTSLYSEVTSWQDKNGPIVVSYTGINGSYQWNRIHFIDFLRSIRRDKH